MLLMRGYVAARSIASLVAIAGYFHLFGGVSDMFLLYDRARGTFNDPNVLGAFLVLPGAAGRSSACWPAGCVDPQRR